MPKTAWHLISKGMERGMDGWALFGGFTYKLGDWTTPPGTTRRKPQPVGGTLSQRRHPLRKFLHSPSPPADLLGARDSKNLPGEEQTLTLHFRQLMGHLQMQIFTAAPTGDGPVRRHVPPHGLQSRRPTASRRSPASTRQVPTVHGTLRQANEFSHRAIERTLHRLLSSAPPPHSLPASQIPRLSEDAHSPFLCSSTASSKVPVLCPSAPRTQRVSSAAPLLIPKVSQQRVTAPRALARVHRAAPSPQPLASEGGSPEPHGARARAAHAWPRLPAPPAQSGNRADEPPARNP